MDRPECIQNAGIILLHPFLSTLFLRLRLTHEGLFVGSAAQQRAVFLLQYIVTGNITATDNNLFLNKILCGLSPTDKVAMGIELSGEEVTIAGELLQVVIQQWDKIKNTSVEGFRSSFLQREAMLTFVDGAWQMKIEQRGYDVLLQTLPWNIGMIKTNWMPQFLYAEWL